MSDWVVNEKLILSLWTVNDGNGLVLRITTTLSDCSARGSHYVTFPVQWIYNETTLLNWVKISTN